MFKTLLRDWRQRRLVKKYRLPIKDAHWVKDGQTFRRGRRYFKASVFSTLYNMGADKYTKITYSEVKPRKVLFLDIDEVMTHLSGHVAAHVAEANGLSLLKNPRAKGTHHEEWLDPTKVLMLACFMERNPDVEIVISSTWRSGEGWLERVTNALNYPLEEDYDWRITGRTGWSSKIRGNEIQEWLDKNQNVDYYIILDDSADMLESQSHKHVWVHGRVGLQESNIKDIARKLEGDWEDLEYGEYND
ncbi:hypothetical protein GR11A_00207 [Vibrio phage vB_VcorM_GR11A]|nr:hypothetical protein GR11A_00207 [Vibrio phage vB_VcorM_GR11A]